MRIWRFGKGDRTWSGRLEKNQKDYVKREKKNTLTAENLRPDDAQNFREFNLRKGYSLKEETRVPLIRGREKKVFSLFPLYSFSISLSFVSYKYSRIF